MSDSSADDAARKERKRERRRARYAANREAELEAMRQYYAANRDKVLAQVREYHAKNGDAIRERARQAYAANPGKAKAYHAARSARGVYRLRHLIRAHGLDLTGWAALWEAQEGRCYLCGNELDPSPDKTHVEHHHECVAHGPEKSCQFCRRGLACARCNHLIGQAGDDPEFLRRIADRLEAANRSVRQRQASAPQQLMFEIE